MSSQELGVQRSLIQPKTDRLGNNEAYSFESKNALPRCQLVPTGELPEYPSLFEDIKSF
jgi:hypothetical protein